MGSLSRASGFAQLQGVGLSNDERLRRLEMTVNRIIQDDEMPIRWNDLSINSIVQFVGAQNPEWVTYRSGRVLSFQDARSDGCAFNQQLSHLVAETYPVEFHVHVIPTNNNAGNVRWQLTVSWAGIGAVFPAISAANTYTADCAIAANSLDTHLIHEIAAEIPAPVGNTVSAGLICTLTRLGTHDNDTYVGDVYVPFFDFHEPRNTSRGSHLERSKWAR